MNRQTWEDLVLKNPMLIEIQRFRRRFLTFSGSNAMNSAVLALILVCYAALVLFVLSGKGDIPPVAVVIGQGLLFTFFAPGMLHGAIAGERERRSWDLLLVAPVSKAQIVVGKFIGAMAALGTGGVLFLVPVLAAAAMYRRTNWHDVLAAEALTLSFAAAVCAFTILISARVRRPFMALGATLGTLSMLLIVLPLLVTVMIGVSGQGYESVVYFLHPFYALIQILQIDSSPWASHDTPFHALWGWPQTFVYLLVAGILVAWAANTLNFAENDVRFLPGGKKDA